MGFGAAGGSLSPAAQQQQFELQQQQQQMQQQPPVRTLDGTALPPGVISQEMASTLPLHGIVVPPGGLPLPSGVNYQQEFSANAQAGGNQGLVPPILPGATYGHHGGQAPSLTGTLQTHTHATALGAAPSLSLLPDHTPALDSPGTLGFDVSHISHVDELHGPSQRLQGLSTIQPSDRGSGLPQGLHQTSVESLGAKSVKSGKSRDTRGRRASKDHSHHMAHDRDNLNTAGTVNTVKTQLTNQTHQTHMTHTNQSLTGSLKSAKSLNQSLGGKSGKSLGAKSGQPGQGRASGGEEQDLGGEGEGEERPGSSGSRQETPFTKYFDGNLFDREYSDLPGRSLKSVQKNKEKESRSCSIIAEVSAAEYADAAEESNVQKGGLRGKQGASADTRGEFSGKEDRDVLGGTITTTVAEGGASGAVTSSAERRRADNGS